MSINNCVIIILLFFTLLYLCNSSKEKFTISSRAGRTQWTSPESDDYLFKFNDGNSTDDGSNPYYKYDTAPIFNIKADGTREAVPKNQLPEYMRLLRSANEEDHTYVMNDYIISPKDDPDGIYKSQEEECVNIANSGNSNKVKCQDLKNPVSSNGEGMTQWLNTKLKQKYKFVPTSATQLEEDGNEEYLVKSLKIRPQVKDGKVFWDPKYSLSGYSDYMVSGNINRDDIARAYGPLFGKLEDENDPDKDTSGYRDFILCAESVDNEKECVTLIKDKVTGIEISDDNVIAADDDTELAAHWHVKPSGGIQILKGNPDGGVGGAFYVGKDWIRETGEELANEPLPEEVSDVVNASAENSNRDPNDALNGGPNDALNGDPNDALNGGPGSNEDT